MVENISFIVIARDEAFAVEKCLGSIASMPLRDCEVICVDSDSTDDTVEIMKGYTGKIENLRIFQCSGFVNAAVARNVGMRYAVKKYIYFVDGDVELYPEFICEALDRMKSGKAEAVTGGLDEIVYSDGYEQITKPNSHRRAYPTVRRIYDSGGTFIVLRELLNMVGSWDERMTRNQDFDYTLRINRHGLMLAVPAVMGIHHTLAYGGRSWKHFTKCYPMFSGMLIRKNLDQPRRLKGVLKNYRIGLTWWGLLFCSTSLVLLLSMPLWPICVSFGTFALMDTLWGVFRKKNVVGRFFAHYLDPPLIYLGIFMDLGRNRQSTTVQRIL